MNKTILTFFSILILCNNAFSQNPLVKQWDKRFGGTKHDYFYSFQQTSDGGFLLGGHSLSGISGDKTQPNWDTSLSTIDYWIVKIDSSGNFQWDKDFGGTEHDYFSSLRQTYDEGYILGGSSYSEISGDKTQPLWGTNGYSDYWIVKIDSIGNKQWDKDLGANNAEYLSSLQQTHDKGYILGGYSHSGATGDKTQPTWGDFDYWIIKIDSMGNKQWDKDFGGTSTDYLLTTQQTTDKGFILGGRSTSGLNGDKTQPTWGGWDYWIVKTDSLGNKQWDKDFGGTDHDYFSSLLQTSDGGYLLGGFSWSGISGDKTEPTWGNSDFWIIKLDSLGNKLWDRDFGGIDQEDDFSNIIHSSEGSYLLTGTSYSNISGDKTENNLGVEQGWVIKIDSIGNKLWDKTIFTNGHDEVCYTLPLANDCYAVANSTLATIGGYKSQPSWGNNDYWIVKFCDTTVTTSIGSPLERGQGCVIYPNPFLDELTIKTQFENGLKSLRLFDLVGREILFKPFQPDIKQYQTTLSLTTLQQGIYFVEVKTEEGRIVRKIVKQ